MHDSQSDRGVAASRAALLWFVKDVEGRLVLLAVSCVVMLVAFQAAVAVGAGPAEVFGAAFGVIGTILLATRTRWAGLGWIAFLASNAAWLWFAHAHGFRFMFWQQVAFTVSSIVGAWVWLLRDRLFAVPAAAERQCASPGSCRWPRCACEPRRGKQP